MSAKTSSARKSVTVKHGNATLTVYPWTHPTSGASRWRFCWRPQTDAPWRYVTRKTKEEAKAAAWKILTELETGEALSALSPDRRRWLEALNREVASTDQARVLEFIASLRKSADIAAAVARFCAGKTSKAGEETPHLQKLRKILESMATHFAGKSVAEIHLPDLTAWWETRCAAAGWKRKKDIRAGLVQFWRWALKESIAGPEPVTVAERLPEIGSEPCAREILTLEQFHAMAAAILPEFRAWFALGCFGGLRPEEIAPPDGKSKKRHKRGIHCEEIDFEFSVLRIAAAVSKGGKRPRIVPMNDALRHALEWAGIRPGMTGPTTLANPAKTGELNRLGKLIFGGTWPKDICRHSYGSYRNAIVRSLPQVAEEMGTSVGMLHNHYHNPRPTEEGNAWFSLRPGDPILIRQEDREGTGSQKAIA